MLKRDRIVQRVTDMLAGAGLLAFGVFLMEVWGWLK
jgi:hypothetical protein